jgi:hypothetical protein
MLDFNLFYRHMSAPSTNSLECQWIAPMMVLRLKSRIRDFIAQLVGTLSHANHCFVVSDLTRRISALVRYKPDYSDNQKLGSKHIPRVITPRILAARNERPILTFLLSEETIPAARAYFSDDLISRCILNRNALVSHKLSNER